jgi:LDH2 family malate/lactate/ureidoglycolate dehydrogenase
MTPTERLDLASVESLARDALLAKGFSEGQASAIANNVTAAERDGCLSHGLFRIPFYVAASGNADCDPTAVPALSQPSGAVVHVDAGHGFCPNALEVGLGPLAETARQYGIAALAIRRVYNIAALWPEVERLAAEGLVAFAFTASNACVAPAGGIQPVFGTNPMAFGFPRSSGPPLVFAQATSASARGEIQLHKREGKPLPEGWAIDADGQPTTDPEAALAGAQLPFGGYKGSSLSLMVELLAGPLIGELSSRESAAHDVNKTGAPFGGEFLIAIDPARCAPPGQPVDHDARAERILADVLGQEGTRLPSSRRYTARERSLVEGVDVSAPLLETIRGYCA